MASSSLKSSSRYLRVSANPESLHIVVCTPSSGKPANVGGADITRWTCAGCVLHASSRSAPPVTVFVVVGDLPQNEIGLHGLRTQNVLWVGVEEPWDTKGRWSLRSPRPGKGAMPEPCTSCGHVSVICSRQVQMSSVLCVVVAQREQTSREARQMFDSRCRSQHR